MTLRTTVIGIDPGKRGAVAFYDAATEGLTIHDMPSFDLRGSAGIDHAGIARVFAGAGAVALIAYIEAVHGRATDGVSAAFSFGYAAGAVQQAIACEQIPIERVSPTKWKQELRVPAEKDRARLRASELLPKHSALWGRQKDDGRAEAALIALYGVRQLKQMGAL